MTPGNWIPAGPQPQPKADIIRRQDVIDQLGRVVDVYEQQQQAMLGTITHGAQHGVFSTADQVRERRWTSAMYLLYYGLVAGAVMFGLTTIAYRFDVVDSYSAFAIWMVGTGSFALWLAWIRHGQELDQTPEAVARHIVDWHGSIAEYDARTRRLALRWEFDAEGQRQQAALAAADAGRQDAQLRIAELEARRRLADTPRMTHDAWTAEPPAVVSTPATTSTWQQDLAVWLAYLYTDADAITEAGIIKGRTPWAQRSPWVDADKQAAKRVCCDLRPAIIVPADGGRWRLRLDMFPSADIAVRLLSQRLADP